MVYSYRDIWFMPNSSFDVICTINTIPPIERIEGKQGMAERLAFVLFDDQVWILRQKYYDAFTVYIICLGAHGSAIRRLFQRKS